MNFIRFITITDSKNVSLTAMFTKSRDKVFRIECRLLLNYAWLLENMSVYSTYTLEKCRRVFKKLWQRIEKEILPFFVLLKSARFSTVSIKFRAIRGFMLFGFYRLCKSRHVTCEKSRVNSLPGSWESECYGAVNSLLGELCKWPKEVNKEERGCGGEW